MGKRKRTAANGDKELPRPAGEAKKKKVAHQEGATPMTIQIIIGTYEKVLHGITASITSQAKGHREQKIIEFADTFLLNAHTSAIRCLAVRFFWSSLSLSLPIPGSQDSCRERRPFWTSCTGFTARALTLGSDADSEMCVDLALLNRFFQVSENHTCQWQL